MREPDDLMEWSADPGTVPLTTRAVHLWRAFLDIDDAQRRPFRELLLDDERRRADRFHFEIHRNRYIISRAVLRALLSRYLQIPGAEVLIGYNEHGKPELVDRRQGLQFNVSHAGDLAVFVFSVDRRVGIDIEETSRELHFRALANRYFSPKEREILESVPDSDLRETFYACWTRKEAYIKALGLGVTHGLRNFTVAIRSGDPPAVLQSEVDQDAPGKWEMRAFVPCRGFVGALAVEGGGWVERAFEFAPARHDSVR